MEAGGKVTGLGDNAIFCVGDLGDQIFRWAGLQKKWASEEALFHG